MVTVEELRLFARDCVHWSNHASNPSDRETILGVARKWASVAEGIERRIDDGWDLACPDLRKKLD